MCSQCVVTVTVVRNKITHWIDNKSKVTQMLLRTKNLDEVFLNEYMIGLRKCIVWAAQNDLRGKKTAEFIFSS